MGKVGPLNLFAVDATPEAALGTAATLPDKAWIGRYDRPQIPKQTVNNKDAQVGVYGSGTQSVIVGKSMTAGPDYDANLDNIAFHLRAILGTIAAPTGAGPYTHTITELQGNTPSFTTYWRGPDTPAGKLERFTGCKVAQLALSMSNGGKVLLRPSWVGIGDHTEQTVAAAPLNTDPLLSAAQLTGFSVSGTDYHLAIEDFELTIDRKIDPGKGKAPGQLTVATLNSTGLEVGVRFTLKDDENDLTGLAALAEANTLVPIIITFTLGTQSAVITLRKVELDSPGESGGTDEQMRQVTGTAYYSPNDTETIRAVVINNTPSYA